MALPDMSNSMYVAKLRYIQTIHEPAERRNPDTMVRHFMPLKLRLRTRLMGKDELTQLRSDPFYYYLLARTKYYDQVVTEAFADGVERFVMVGCGSDTRSYRFKDTLLNKGIKVLECDQAASINEKKRLTKQWQHFGHVEYLAIDLNDHEWPQFEHWLGAPKPKTLVMIEGVSPYINEKTFSDFLRLLASDLAPGSHVAYDFKIGGVKDDFGRSERTGKPFRLTTSKEQAVAFHKTLGLQLDHMELSSELSKRLVPNLNGQPLFEEDGLLRLRVTGV
jgi:methyltransferase (TIGR00027 family)